MTWYESQLPSRLFIKLHRDMLRTTSRPNRSSRKFSQPPSMRQVQSSSRIRIILLISNIEAASLCIGRKTILASHQSLLLSSILSIHSTVPQHCTSITCSSGMAHQYTSSTSSRLVNEPLGNQSFLRNSQMLSTTSISSFLSTEGLSTKRGTCLAPPSPEIKMS